MGDYPEEDDSKVLNDIYNKKFQMLIGLLNWLVNIGRLDIAFATSSLSRFTACPRQGHLERAVQVFEYLKQFQNRQIVVDSRDPIFEGDESVLDLDYTKIFK